MTATLQALFPDLVPKPPFRPFTDVEINEIWANAVFTPDTNVLLRLYELSDVAKTTLMENMKLLAARQKLMITHQAAKEFMTRRVDAIERQANKYNKEAVGLENCIEERIQNPLQHNKPTQFVSDSAISTVIGNLNAIRDELIAKATSVASLVDTNNDVVIGFINRELGNCIQPAMDEATFRRCEEEFKLRLQKRTPPGYEDKGKVGDYIIWQQTIKFAKDKNCNIVIITEETKEDWWKLDDKTMVHPRIELLKEFLQHTNCKLHLASIETFLKRQGASPAVVSEVKELSDKELLHHRIDHLLPNAVFQFDEFSAGELIRVCNRLMSSIEDQRHSYTSNAPTTKNKFIEHVLGSKFRIHLVTLRRVLSGITDSMPRSFPNNLFYVLSNAESEINLLLHNDRIYTPNVLEQFTELIRGIRIGGEQLVDYFKS